MHIHFQLWEDMLELCQALSEQQYCKKTNILSQTSVGEHVRHAFEFYDCLLNGIPKQIVNYENRARDNQLENDCAYAQRKIKHLLERLEHLPTQIPIELVTKEARTKQTSSSSERELVYCLDHAIHHQALIKIGLSELNMQHVVNDHFGVAYSTLRYRGQIKV